MKFISFICFYLALSLNPLIAEPLLTKSQILRKSNECFKELQYQICKKLVLKLEKIQVYEFEKNRFKCQSSILGLQTELIKVYYFKKSKNKNNNGIMTPYVIKNC